MQAAHSQVSGYTPTRLQGPGGMAQVWRVRPDATGVEVALERVRLPDARHRLLDAREVETAAAMDHAAVAGQSDRVEAARAVQDRLDQARPVGTNRRFARRSPATRYERSVPRSAR